MIKRDVSAKFINLIGLCIWLVMFGHILERIPALSTNICGWLVYSFHSALFVACMGRITHFNWKWSAALYALSLLTPAWWIGTTALCALTIPLLQKVSTRWRWLAVLMAIICGVIFGFCPDPHGIAAKLHLTRTFAFYPYFMFGAFGLCEKTNTKAKYICAALTIATSIVAGCIAAWKPLPFLMSMAYMPGSAINTYIWRIVAYVIGFGMVYATISFMKSTPWKGLYATGLTALTVYITHNYVITIAVGFTKMLGSLITLPVAAGIITVIFITALTIICRGAWRIIHKGGAI